MESKDEIKQRLLRAAARAWGIEESRMDLEAFDPLVRLLVEAQSGEFARLERTLVESEARILERMLEQLSPEILTGPRPAHAIATARSIRPKDVVDTTHQFYLTRDTGSEKVDVHFTPLADYTVYDAAVQAMEVGGRIVYSQSISGGKERLIRDGKGGPEAASTIHIGVHLDGKIEDVYGLRFYFHWLNAARQDELLLYLKMAEWSVNGKPIDVHHGLFSESKPRSQEVESSLADEYSRYARSRREIEEEYQDNFVTLVGLDPKVHGDISANKTFYPKVLEDSYELKDLAALRDNLFWVTVKFPVQFPAKTLLTTICAVNAFPIVNYQLHQKKGNLRDQVNIIPLPTDDYYFDVVRVENAAGERYHEIPLTNIRNYAAGQFSVRWRDVAKLDKRAASLALMNLLDALRDESSAFSAYGLDTISTKIAELNQNIKGLEQLVLEQNHPIGHLAFLVAKPRVKDRNLIVKYLSSSGSKANGVLGETKLNLRRSGRINRKTIFTITSSRGGARPLGAQDRKYAYKKAIISRGRVVSREDIRAFAGAHFVDEIAGIEINKGYSTGLGPWQGLMRTIEVSIRFKPESLEASDPARIAIRMIKLEKELNRNTSAVLPIRVISPDIAVETVENFE